MGEGAPSRRRILVPSLLAILGTALLASAFLLASDMRQDWLDEKSYLTHPRHRPSSAHGNTVTEGAQAAGTAPSNGQPGPSAPSTLYGAAVGAAAWLPTDMQAWPHHQPGAVPWDRGLLSSGTVVPGYEQLRPFFDKLRSGQRVVVLALGSSIVANAGGQFARDVSLLHDLVSDYPDTQEVDRVGFLTLLMEVINTTWPHPDHVLVNLGVPGTSFSVYALHSCLEAKLPHQVDLILIQQHEPVMKEGGVWNNMGDPDLAEQLLRRLLGHWGSSRPAILIANTPLLATVNASIGADPVQSCLRAPAQYCDVLCRDSFTTVIEDSASGRLSLPEDAVFKPLARHYGLSSLSVTRFLDACYRAQLPERLGLSRCRFLGRVLEDVVHPNKLLGRLMWADLLVQHLVQAQEYLRAAPAPKTVAAAHQQPALPERPLYPRSRQDLHTRCYGALSRNAARSSGSGGSAAGSTPAAAAVAVHQLQVVSASGWTFTEWQVHGAVKKYKPGWVALQPGDTIQFQINTSFMDAAARLAMPPEVVPQSLVALVHLRSYEHMGTAKWTCVSGCTCEALEVNAHDGTFQISIAQGTSHVVTQHDRCVMQVEVLPATSSGEHKFKLIQVVAGHVVLV
mmetsp:Transcript_29685/g.65694  ORF Transcript_29685/g.65694 Transcript_29685/m.65694 type:complete len:622 (+) Transcript_29685:62-1927(+)|eukprot:CAMPEP_0202899238 /NCGR_PEP_ID=MMETSP1392-20130828/7528_1 /ASSEMBLY_ACC=CAM_ASM_000868 /TAXON_ID=225041 /ORGANISM="Chlamydomonas chlamydogama, Strain SAG 11-48b" /LENGTH=621 /DNA_ID=CAMNT_0049585363 /DNA_START=55 /DNA_END=1920 /DNA_ORIENTATION=+